MHITLRAKGYLEKRCPIFLPFQKTIFSLRLCHWRTRFKIHASSTLEQGQMLNQVQHDSNFSITLFAKKKLYTLLSIEKAGHIQTVYEEKTLKVSSYTYCIRVKNTKSRSYTICIRGKNTQSRLMYILYTTRKRSGRAIYNMYTSQKQKKRSCTILRTARGALSFAIHKADSLGSLCLSCLFLRDFCQVRLSHLQI